MFYLDKFLKYVFSHQVEDLKSQLVSKADMELKLVEDNRVLQQMVMRTDTEKKRLSMENEQLSWKMSQSFIGSSSRDFTSVLNTPEGKSCNGNVSWVSNHCTHYCYWAPKPFTREAILLSAAVVNFFYFHLLLNCNLSHNLD